MCVGVSRGLWKLISGGVDLNPHNTLLVLGVFLITTYN